MNFKSFRPKLTEAVFRLARTTELIVSIIISIVIAVLILKLIQDLLQTQFSQLNDDYFTTFLANSLHLVVGVEFIKMLCKHTPETLVEVLMFATARQMVVSHLSPIETLVGILSIGILFTIRKYLFVKPSDSERLEDKF